MHSHRLQIDVLTKLTQRKINAILSFHSLRVSNEITITIIFQRWEFESQDLMNFFCIRAPVKKLRIQMKYVDCETPWSINNAEKSEKRVV